MLAASHPAPPPPLPTPPAGTGWIEAALIVFFVVFLAIVASVLLRRKGHYRDASRIPLEDDVVTPRGDAGTDTREQP